MTRNFVTNLLCRKVKISGHVIEYFRSTWKTPPYPITVGLTLGSTQPPVQKWAAAFPRGYRGRGFKLTRHLSPVPRLRVNASVSPLALYLHGAYRNNVTFTLCKLRKHACLIVGFESRSNCFHSPNFLNMMCKISPSTSVQSVRNVFTADLLKNKASFSPHGTTRQPLDGFLRNLIFELFLKPVQEIQVYLKFKKNNG